jgi:allantoin racemase
MRLLLINPNTSTHITARMATSASAALRPGETLQAVTANGQPTVVHDATTLARAEVNALALAAEHGAAADAIVLGISLDGAAVALRERCGATPVVGMTEAALMSACLRSARVGLLTLGPALLPLYRQRVAEIGLAARVVAWQAPVAPQAFEPTAGGVEAAVLAELVEAGRRLLDDGAQALVLAGAVLCGYERALGAALGCTVFDGVACAVGQARILLDAARARSD